MNEEDKHWGGRFLSWRMQSFVKYQIKWNNLNEKHILIDCRRVLVAMTTKFPSLIWGDSRNTSSLSQSLFSCVSPARAKSWLFHQIPTNTKKKQNKKRTRRQEFCNLRKLSCSCHTYVPSKLSWNHRLLKFTGLCSVWIKMVSMFRAHQECVRFWNWAAQSSSS